MVHSTLSTHKGTQVGWKALSAVLYFIQITIQCKNKGNQTRIQKLLFALQKPQSLYSGNPCSLYSVKLDKSYTAFNRELHMKEKRTKRSLPAGLVRMLLGACKQDFELPCIVQEIGRIQESNSLDKCHSC